MMEACYAVRGRGPETSIKCGKISKSRQEFAAATLKWGRVQVRLFHGAPFYPRACMRHPAIQLVEGIGLTALGVSLAVNQTATCFGGFYW
jgi:hypothetical protein